jgi:CHAD domain-containing protein
VDSEVIAYDSDDRRLAQAGLTLARQAESRQSAWELRFADDTAHSVLIEPDGDDLPTELQSLLRGVLLGRELEAIPSDTARAQDEDRKKGRQSDRRWLQSRIREQLRQLQAHDPAVRLDHGPDDVHKMRVAVRRLRALLRMTRPALDHGWAESLRAELAWLGERLGAVRDLDVINALFTDDAASLSAGDAVIAGQLLHPLRVERSERQRDLLGALDSDRYLELLRRLEAATTDVPLEHKLKPRRLAAKEYGRLIRRGPLDPELSNAALHKRRIRVKRARYAAEFATPEPDKQTRRFLAATTELQDLLGQHQDAVVGRRRLRQLAHQSVTADAALVAGRLIERQEGRADTARSHLRSAWRQLEHRGKRTW